MGLLNTTTDSFGISLNALGRLNIRPGVWNGVIYKYDQDQCKSMIYDHITKVPVDRLTIDMVVDAIKSLVREEFRNFILSATVQQRRTLGGNNHFTITTHMWGGICIQDGWQILLTVNPEYDDYVFNEFLRMCNTYANKYGFVAELTNNKYIFFATSNNLIKQQQ